MESNRKELDPWYVTGFFDGEGCFSLIINTENKKRKGFISTCRYWVVDLSIHLREDDKKILDDIQKFFVAGRVNEIRSYHGVHYNVRDRKDIIDKVIPHFENFPLRAKKNRDFLLWKEAVMILELARCRKKTRFDGQLLGKSEETRLYEIKDLLSERLRGRKRSDYIARRGTVRTGKMISRVP